MDEEIISLSNSGLAIEDIADELGCSEDKVYNVLVSAGLL